MSLFFFYIVTVPSNNIHSANYIGFICPFNCTGSSQDESTKGGYMRSADVTRVTRDTTTDLSRPLCYHPASEKKITWPYACYVTLGSRCKMANSSSEDDTDTLPERPTRISRISLSLSGRILKEYRNIVSVRHAVFHGVCEIALTEVLATQMGVMRQSKESQRPLNCINLIHFRLTAGRLRGSSCIVIPGVVCELLQFAATQ